MTPSDVSSTDVEKQEAFTLAKKILTDLSKNYGFPPPLLCDSGNGYHLLYKIDLANTKENVEMLKKFLQALDFIYSTDKVDIDRSNYNPARITKLYGTIACKGENTHERPHRQSQILKIPDKLLNVTLEKMQSVIALLPTQETAADKPTNKSKKIDIEKWLADHSLDVAFSADFHGEGTKYIFTTCPWRSEHTNKSAYLIQFKNGAIAAGCHHNSCQGENWHSLRDIIEPNWRDKTKSDSSDDDKNETQVEAILRLAGSAKLLHDDREDAYARVIVKDHTEIFRIGGDKFKLWLAFQYYTETQKAYNADSYKQALGILIAQAIFDGELIKIFKRCAWYNDALYYDLNNENREIVRITPDGWEITTDADVLFSRSKLMFPQVTPVSGGELLQLLDKHYRFKDNNDKILHSVNLMLKFIPHIPHLIDVLYGEKGASKTTTMRKDRKIVDPNMSELLKMPNSIENLAIVPNNHYYPCFDNLDNLSAEKSDLLCVAATGGCYSKRTLYSNDDETILKFLQPVGLNGINIVATRPDLLDRSIVLELARIPKSERKTEKEVWDEFNADLPMILGGIFTVISKALSILPTVELPELERMADICTWGYAVAEAAGIGGGNFIRAFSNNTKRANKEAIDSHPVAAAVVKLMADKNDWCGTATALLGELNKIAEQDNLDTKSYTWARHSNTLSRRLREIKSNLEQEGIYVDFNESSKIITLKK